MRLLRLSLLTLALTACVALAQANTITVGPSPVIGPLVGGSYLWAYGVTLDGNSQITNGDFFTIFDFAGFVAASQNAPAGWTPSSTTVGTCPTDTGFPALCALTDSPALPNLTWTRTGGTIVGPGANAPPTLLGLFTARSIYNLPTNDFWVSQDDDLQTGTNDEGAGGNTNVPRAVPEPLALSLVGLGLAGVAIRRRRTQP